MVQVSAQALSIDDSLAVFEAIKVGARRSVEAALASGHGSQAVSCGIGKAICNRLPQANTGKPGLPPGVEPDLAEGRDADDGDDGEAEQ